MNSVYVAIAATLLTASAVFASANANDERTQAGLYAGLAGWHEGTGLEADSDAYPEYRATSTPTLEPTATATPEPTITPTPEPTYAPPPPATIQGNFGGVEQWRALVESMWPAHAVETVMCIMQHESGGIVSNIGAAGERGLMQIHPVHDQWLVANGWQPYEMFTAEHNLAAALLISNYGEDFSDWTTYWLYCR